MDLQLCSANKKGSWAIFIIWSILIYNYFINKSQSTCVLYYLCSCAISWLISSSSLIPVNSPEPTELELSCVTGANGQYCRFHRTHDTTTPQTHTHGRVEEHQTATTQEQIETSSTSTINTRGSQETAAFTALDLSQMLSDCTSLLTGHRKHLFCLFFRCYLPITWTLLPDFSQW